MSHYTIINGDCLTELCKLEPSSVDLIFADPPYWMRTGGVLRRVEGTEYDGCADEWDNQFFSLADYAVFTRKWLDECRRVLKSNGSIWVIGSMQCIYTIGNALQEAGYWIINDVIWHKTNPTPNFMGTRLNNSHETLIWAAKSKEARYTFHYKTAKELNRDTVGEEEYAQGVRKQMGSVWRFPVCSGKERLKEESGHKLHSTQKPYSLLYRIINIASSVGDTVLDPFAGTFTTGEAALRCGRNFIGIDASKKYCIFGRRRLDSAVEHLGNIERATFDIKPKKVEFTDLIKSNYLHANERLYLKGRNTFATLQSDGKVMLPKEDSGCKENLITDIHTGAARLAHVKAERVNGFDYWYVLRDDKRISLNEIRDSYRSHNKPVAVQTMQSGAEYAQVRTAYQGGVATPSLELPF